MARFRTSSAINSTPTAARFTAAWAQASLVLGPHGARCAGTVSPDRRAVSTASRAASRRRTLARPLRRENNVLLQVALAHQELLRAAQEQAIVKESLAQAQELSELTGQFAQAGQGAAADADRAITELSQRQIEVFRTEESIRVAGARLAQLLRLDQNLRLMPAEPTVLPLEIVRTDIPLRELTATGLSQRPELAEQRFLVGEAVTRFAPRRVRSLDPQCHARGQLRRPQFGHQRRLASTRDRLDFDALAYWEIRNLVMAMRRRSAKHRLS